MRLIGVLLCAFMTLTLGFLGGCLLACYPDNQRALCVLIGAVLLASAGTWAHLGYEVAIGCRAYRYGKEED